MSKKRLLAVAAISYAAVSVPAHAAVDLSSLWAEIDLSGVSTEVIAVGVVAVGIAVALKAISLAKRAVSKA
jgi:hypothetical protein